MKRRNLNGFFAGMLTMLLIVAMVGSASATTGKMTKEIEYKNIAVSLDGTKLNLKDAKGNAVEPFMFNGTNYIPARALAEALGLSVSWNGSTNTIVLTHGSAATSGTYSRSNPAPIGVAQSISIENYSYGNYNATVSVSEVKRGADAWNMIKAANMFNSEAQSGNEYILANVTATINSTSKDTSISLSDFDFKAYSGSNSAYSSPSVVCPSPEFEGDAFKGGTISGWIVFEVSQNDSSPKMVFGQDYSGAGGIWFDLK